MVLSIQLTQMIVYNVKNLIFSWYNMAYPNDFITVKNLCFSWYNTQMIFIMVQNVWALWYKAAHEYDFNYGAIVLWTYLDCPVDGNMYLDCPSDS